VPSSIPNSAPIKWVFKGLTDAADGTNSFPGAMSDLINLIPDPSTAGVYVPRPAAKIKTDFTGSNAPTGAGVLSAMLTVGDLEYGMVASTLNPGKDEPFCYDLANDVFLPVSGITNANTPTSPAASGDWVPPIMAQVAGRIIVCHPGFPGGAIKFGWFDVSGFTETTFGNTHSNTLIDGNPSIIGVQPGMTITGSGIPANTSVVATAPVVLVIPGILTGNTFFPATSAAGVAVGQDAAGAGLLGGTIVTSVNVSPFSTTGDTHSNNVLDDIDPANGIPHIGDIITGPPDIPTSTTVVSFVHIDLTGVCALDGTTTIIVSQVTNGALAAAQFVSGFGITPGTKVVTVTPFSLVTTGDVATGSGVIINLASTTGLVAGMAVNFVGIPNPGFIVSVDSGTQVTISQSSLITATGIQINFTASIVLLDTTATITLLADLLFFQSLSVVMSADATGTTNGLAISFNTVQSISLSQASTISSVVENITFSGGTITLSQAATATADDVSLTIAGGTQAAPLWGAGDCDRNPLPSTPLAVAEMNGRAWFADGPDGIPISDSGFPCRRSNQPNVQALTTNDGVSVTMIAPIELTSPLVGGIVEGLIAFQGEAQMRQITGDPSTNNLAMNLLPVATGTLAPLSVIPCSLGTAFISPQGLRFVRPDGSVTDPIGVDGQGVTHPFQYAKFPSRICAEANVAVLRITVQHGSDPGEPFQEFWFDLSRKTWSGPHSFPARLIQHWRSTFVMAPLAVNASMWRSNSVGPHYNGGSPSDFVENGQQLSWIAETVLLPDNEALSMNAVVESNLMCAAAISNPIQVTAFSERRAIINMPLPLTPAASNTNLTQRLIAWTRPLIFKQMSVRMTGLSGSDVRLGNLYMRYQILGYNLDEGDDFFLLSSRVPFPILLADDGTPLLPG
jgi:hypothetical protein